MKKILIIFSALLLNTFAFAAGSDSGGSEETLYNDAVKLITVSYTHLTLPTIPGV